ncbi:MAG: PLP-dependent aminotransferase family protein [Hyphomicrobium sp.]|jgi:DNA-binding transcriptional MocR family regulator
MDWIPTIGDRNGPVYLRIVAALADDIAAGRLHHGQVLPTHRMLAATLGIDLTTVTRAYTEARRQGLTDARVGRGTYVRAGGPPQARPAMAPGIDLSMNIPPQPSDADLSARLAGTFGELRAEARLESHLNYQQPGGSRSERAVAAEWLQRLTPGVTAEQLVIAPGTQSALFSLLLIHARPGGRIFTEAMTYPGLKTAATSLGIELIGIGTDPNGMDPAALDSACRKNPDVRLIYLMPTMHNPTTTTMPPQRREKIAAIVAKHDLTLIEDDPYAFLTTAIIPIASLIPERAYLLASLSKSITPGLRFSLVACPSELQAVQLIGSLRASLQMSVPLALAVMTRWLRDGTADTIIKAVSAEAAARQRLAADALAGSTYAADSAGHHVWLTLPAKWSSAKFAAHLQRRGLGVVTADAFATMPTPPDCIRIALGAAPSRPTLVKALEILRQSLVADDLDEQVV